MTFGDYHREKTMNHDQIPDCRSIHQQLSAEAVKRQLDQADKIEALQGRILKLQGELRQARAEAQRIDSRLSKALIEAHDAIDAAMSSAGQEGGKG